MPQTDEQKRFFRKARKVARRLIDDYDRACEAQHRRLAPEVDRITDEVNRIVGTIADGDPDPNAIMARIRTRAASPSAPPNPGPTIRTAPPAPPPTPWPQPPAQTSEPSALTAPPTPPPTPPQPTAQTSGPTARTDAPPTPKQPEPDLTARPTPPEPPTAPRPSTQTSEPAAAPEPPSPELLEVRQQIAAVEARILLDTERERLIRLNLESLRQRKRLADQEAELAALKAELAAASAASPECAAPFTAGLAATLSTTTPSTSSTGAPVPHRATAPGAPSASSEPPRTCEPTAQLTLVVPLEPSSPRPRSARHRRAAPPPAAPIPVPPTVSPGVDVASDQAEPPLVDSPRPAASAPILAATPEAAHHSTAATPTAAAGIPAAPTASTSPPSPQGVARPQVAEPLTPAPTDIDPSDDLLEAEASASGATPAGVAPPCTGDHPGAETSPGTPAPASVAPPASAAPPCASDHPEAPGDAPLARTNLDRPIVVDHPRAPTDAPATFVAADPDPDPIAIIHQADEAMAAGDHLRAAALFAVVEDLARPAYQATGNADGAAAFLVSILRGAAEAHLKRAALADALPKSQESFALAAQLHDDEPSPVSLADLAASARVHADVLRACGRPHDAAGLIDDILLLATRARPRLHSEDLRHELKCILALRRDLERDPHRPPHPAHNAHH